MGSCHIEVSPEFLERIRAMPEVTIIRESHSDTVVALIETSFLRDGYHGVQEIFTWPCSPNILRFRQDADV